MNPNKDGDLLSFYLEYEYEFEVTRVCYCAYMYTWKVVIYNVCIRMYVCM